MSHQEFRVEAEVCNAEGAYDGAYEWGDSVGGSGEMVGTPEEIAAELVRFLKAYTKEDMEEMKYGTGDFYFQLRIRPVQDPQEQS